MNDPVDIQEYPSPPAGIRPGQKSWLRRWSRNAIIASILFHLIFGVVAVYIVAVRMKHKPQGTFVAEPPPRPRLEPRKLEMKVKIQDLQKRSSRPRLQPRMTVQAPTDLALPEIKKDPKKIERQVKRNYSTLGRSGFGSGIGGGFGDGMGGGTSFFGLKTLGRRIVYIVDFSASMKGTQDKLMRREFKKSIDALPLGAEVSLILFSGPAWQAGQSPNYVRKKWKQGKNGWTRNGGLPQARWTRVDFRSKEKLKDYIDDTALSYGTDWKPGFQMAMALTPKPDAIYFMTDGRPQVKNESSVVSMMNAWNKKNVRKVPVNAIAIKDPKIAKYMKALAEQSGGQYKIVK